MKPKKLPRGKDEPFCKALGVFAQRGAQDLWVSAPGFKKNHPDVGTAWRIIPVSKWLIIMVSKSPKDRVVPLPNGLLNGL